MSNMTYCRFQNTLNDLRDCVNEMEQPTAELSREELRAKNDLIELCRTIIDQEGAYEENYLELQKENNDESDLAEVGDLVFVSAKQLSGVVKEVNGEHYLIRFVDGTCDEFERNEFYITT